jgi:hypothetical protein
VFQKFILVAIAAAVFGLGVCQSQAAQQAAISLHDGLVWADVNCNGTTMHFVVDTGAACTCVNLASIRRAGLRLGEPVSVSGVNGRAIGYHCAAFNGTVGGMKLPAQILALDLSGPARACSQPIDGLIGADFFQGNVVRIDYSRRVLTRRGAGSSGGESVRLRFEGGVLCVPVAVDGSHSRWTRLDTGCTDALIWYGGAGAKSKDTSHTVALASSSRTAIPAVVTVGGISTRAIPVKWCNRAIFPGEAGLLGNAALSQYRAITIDGLRKRLELSL